MKLKALSIDGKIYGMTAPLPRQINEDCDLPEVQRFLRHLTLCNTVVPEKRRKGDIENDDEPRMQSSSPDEMALVMGAHICGYKFLDRTQNLLTFSVVNYKF